MPIETPTTPPSGSKTLSDFVICQDFAFRVSTVDGFSHQTFADGTAVTSVNFKSYTQSVTDPERKLFDFLVGKLKPNPVD
jgi:hypothetical protein